MGSRKAIVGPVCAYGYGVRIQLGGETIKMRVGRRTEWFELHKFCGPTRLVKGGEEAHPEVWDESDPFWPLFQRWIDGGMLVNESSGYAVVPPPKRGDG